MLRRRCARISIAIFSWQFALRTLIKCKKLFKWFTFYTMSLSWTRLVKNFRLSYQYFEILGWHVLSSRRLKKLTLNCLPQLSRNCWRISFLGLLAVRMSISFKGKRKKLKKTFLIKFKLNMKLWTSSWKRFSD